MSGLRVPGHGGQGSDHTDEGARRLIREAIDDTLIVEAAAGTGKTTELVNRIVGVLREGRAEVREVVAVTFTEKAAGELKLRLRQRLEEERRAAVDDGAVRARLDLAVQQLEEAHISTIHGFCADLLRERPVEARVDPLFRVLTDGQAQRLFREAFSGWLQRQLERPPEGVRRSLRRPSRSFRPGEMDEDGPIERLRRAAWDLVEWRDFSESWTRELFDRAGLALRLVELVHALADLSASPSYVGDNLYLDTEPVRRLSRDLRQGTLVVAEEDVDGLEAQLVELRHNRDFKRGRKGSGPTYRKGVARAQVLEARDALILALNEFQERADADLAALLRDELADCIDHYTALKIREGALDFLDLLVRARDLVRNNPVVRQHFQQRFRRIFVDEFQDTDPLQAELLLLLASRDPGETRWQHAVPERGKLFIVGDPKQSIYRFRRADVETYARVCRLLVESGATAVQLRRSFRSVPNIQRAVNAAFAPVMDGDAEGLQAHYVPLEPSRPDHPGQPSVVVLPVPEPYGQRYVAAREIERSLPDAIGAYADWLVRESGWTVTERRPTERRVRLQARHICILFRRFVSYGEDVTRPYVEALEARGLPHLLVGGRAFHDREEIDMLRSALMAIEWPDDQLSVFATLRGPLFAIGDEELLEYHHRCGRFHPFRVPDAVPVHLAALSDALGLIASLHRRRNRRAVADTIAELLAATRAHVGLVLRPGGEQALANVLHVAELARQYEREGGMSFRGFIDTLQAEAAGAAAEAPILEEGSDGVRLMTVHKAKGLEFPVVILADITARLTPWDASRFIDNDRRVCALRLGGWSPKDLNDHRELELLRERREGERVAYVAATRARDLLVVPGIGDEPYDDGWVSPMNAAIYPAAGERRSPAQAAGCPSFRSKDSVLTRPGGDPFRSYTVCPGEHRFEAHGAPYSVVWWSPEPEVLTLGAEASLGLRRDDLIVKDVAAPVLAAHLEAYTAWKTSRDAAISAASVPSVQVVTATHWARTAPEEPSDAAAAATAARVLSARPVEVIPLDGDPHRPGGARFGTLVHAVLAAVPLDADAGTVANVAGVHGRLLAATDVETAAAVDIVSTVLSHPVLDRARSALLRGRCLRETPVTLVHDGVLIEGIVDLAFEHDGAYEVIDFKTDRAEGELLARYQRQVGLYAEAVARATSRPTRACILKV
jgi:ATP-dependent exoDNAse (exonuclease V) beta subunit